LKINLEEKECSRCRKLKKSKDNYYLASNDLINKDHRIGICKLCLEEIVDFPNTELFIDILRQIDRPFLRAEYDASLVRKKPFGEYMRRLAMAQNRTLNYLDSSFEQTFLEKQPKSSKDLTKKLKPEDVVKFNVTPQMVVKWGGAYEEKDLFQLEQFYVDMENGNNIVTPQHKEQLKLFCKVNLEQNKALEDKRFGEFKTLNQQYNKILQDSGFRPIDKQSGGESAGIRSFSQIWEEIEKDGFVPKHNVEVTQDIVDGTILHVSNYTHRLLNMQVMSSPPEDTPKVSDYDEL
jgi:hypothetical protein